MGIYVYVNRSQTHECGNWDCGGAIPFLEIFVSNFRYWLFAVYTACIPTVSKLEVWLPAVDPSLLAFAVVAQAVGALRLAAHLLHCAQTTHNLSETWRGKKKLTEKETNPEIVPKHLETYERWRERAGIYTL
jgi:hypothetical protein